MVIQVQIEMDYQTQLVFPYRTTGDSQTEQQSCELSVNFGIVDRIFLE